MKTRLIYNGGTANWFGLIGNIDLSLSPTDYTICLPYRNFIANKPLKPYLIISDFQIRLHTSEKSENVRELAKAGILDTEEHFPKIC